MKAFVTGGTGFVGSHIVEHLLDLAEFEEVRVLIRKEEKWLKGLNYTPVKSTLENLKPVKDALYGVDVLIHGAAILHASSYSDFFTVNVEATKNLVELAVDAGVSNIIILSSLAATGPSSQIPLTEQTLLSPISAYGRSKKQMEEEIHRLFTEKNWAKNPNLSIKIIRPTAVYGPRETDIYGLFKALKYRIAPIISNPIQKTISLVHVQDLVNGILTVRLYNHAGIHTYFLGGPEDGYSWNEIYKECSVILGKSFLRIRVPKVGLMAIAKMSETITPIFGMYPALNLEKAEELTQSWLCSSNKAKKDWGYSPKISLIEGLQSTLNWYQNHNWL
tara:strand:+ start:16244 stop:17242 length:999 start_codon:yes stop_codon:yes gene_type:complete